MPRTQKEQLEKRKDALEKRKGNLDKAKKYLVRRLGVVNGILEEAKKDLIEERSQYKKEKGILEKEKKALDKGETVRKAEIDKLNVKLRDVELNLEKNDTKEESKTWLENKKQGYKKQIRLLELPVERPKIKEKRLELEDIRLKLKKKELDQVGVLEGGFGGKIDGILDRVKLDPQINIPQLEQQLERQVAFFKAKGLVTAEKKLENAKKDLDEAEKELKDLRSKLAKLVVHQMIALNEDNFFNQKKELITKEINLIKGVEGETTKLEKQEKLTEKQKELNNEQEKLNNEQEKLKNEQEKLTKKQEKLIYSAITLDDTGRLKDKYDTFSTKMKSYKTSLSPEIVYDKKTKEYKITEKKGLRDELSNQRKWNCGMAAVGLFFVLLVYKDPKYMLSWLHSLLTFITHKTETDFVEKVGPTFLNFTAIVVGGVAAWLVKECFKGIETKMQDKEGELVYKFMRVLEERESIKI